MAGIIAGLGSGAPSNLYVGQRVAALHELGAPYGAFAEYAVVKAFAVIPIPDEMSFEEAATLPMAVAVSSVGLFANDCLAIRTEPWLDGEADRQPGSEPILIYGAATQVGAMAIKLARTAGIGPLLCVAGRGEAFVRELIDESSGDVLLDYRNGDDALIKATKETLGDRALVYAFDAVSGGSSYTNIGKLLSPGARLALVLPGKLEEAGLGDVNVSYAMAGSCWKRLQPRDNNPSAGKHNANLGILEGGPAFAQGMSLYVAKLLAQGKLTGHPYEVISGGLGGLDEALKSLKEGKNSALKYLVRVPETPGLEFT
jgi:NADPH:quinone reductase